MSETQHIDLDVDIANPISDLRKLIPHARPNWMIDDVQFHILPRGVDTGCLNTMVKAFVTADKQNTLMFRVYRFKDFDEYLTRGREIYNVKLINNLYGFAPNIILSYANGFCYNYIQGDIMTPKDLSREDNWKIIAKQIALFHSTPIDEKCQSESKIQQLFKTLPDIYPESMKDPKQNKRLQEELPKKAYVQREMKEILKVIESLDYKSCFCHHDLRAENMVWNKENGSITFVDFELASFGRQAGDIAYHFWRFTGVVNNDYSQYPGKDFQLAWLKLYLETYNRATKGSDVVSDKELERLYIQVNVHYLLNLVQTICCVANIDNYDPSIIPIDVFDCAVPSYIEYRRVKDSILALTTPMLENGVN